MTSWSPFFHSFVKWHHILMEHVVEQHQIRGGQGKDEVLQPSSRTRQTETSLRPTPSSDEQLEWGFDVWTI